MFANIISFNKVQNTENKGAFSFFQILGLKY